MLSFAGAIAVLQIGEQPMKKLGFALISLSLLTPACAEQPGKKKDERAAKNKDKKSGDKKAADKKAADKKN